MKIVSIDFGKNNFRTEPKLQNIKKNIRNLLGEVCNINKQHTSNFSPKSIKNIYKQKHFSEFMNINEIKEIKDNFPKEIIESTLSKNKRLSDIYKAKIYLKNEDEQIVRSYKIRGAFNFINKLSQEEKQKGVVCASAGNHSQGVAFCCSFFKIKGVVFMPKTTPSQKIRAVKEFGKEFVEIKITGDNFDESFNKAKEFCKENKMVFISPFNDENVIKGSATIGLEIISQFKKQEPKKEIDYIFIPLGGGGILSGVSEVFKNLSPKTKIIGVEPKSAACGYLSLKRGKNTQVNIKSTFVDGASVKKMGSICFKYILKNVSQINVVDENRLCSSILYFLEKEGRIIELAGILSIDSLKDFREKIKGKNVVCIVSGSNFDFGRFSEINERSLKYEGLKKYILCQFPQREGALKEFVNFLVEGMNITRFEYLKKTNKEKGSVLIGIETHDKKSFETFFNKLKENNWDFKDITHNNLLFDLLV